MRRKLFPLPLAIALSVSVAGLWIVRGHRDIQPSDRQAMSSAAAYYDSVLADAGATAAPPSDDVVVALGYLQRLRLGLSNPFRLAAYALDDPRLAPDQRRRVAWAVLQHVRRGEAYVVDPQVFGADTARRRAFLEIVDREIRSAADPRTGEVAVRLGFTMAAARGSVSAREATIAIQVAALFRDRALADRDLDLLLRLGARRGDGVLNELVRGRASRDLSVERPPLTTIGAAAQRQATVRASAILRDLTDPAPRSAAPRSVPLPPQVVRRLGVLALEQPPETPVVVSLSSDRGLREAAPDPSTSIVPTVTNEEGLAALAGAFVGAADSERVAVSQSVLTCAVALRTLAQQTPWFANDGNRTPSASDLENRYGLRSVSFDARVPPAWRPFYRRELGSALADMKRVLPRMSTNGLRVLFGLDGLPDSALAMHDPRTRTLRLSIYTSGGTLAHELAHDLDWQAARRLYADGIGYSTDRAVRESQGTLGASVRDLAGRRLPAPGSPGAAGASGVMRPAEVFARGADWLVASALAREGRSNGFLSAVQDAELAGYAAGPPTIAGARPVRSAVLALRNMTFVPDSVAAGLQRQWGDPNLADPMLLVRRVLDAPMPWRSVWRSSRRIAPTREGALSSWSPQTACSSPDIDGQPGLRLIILAADSRARGVLTKRAAAWAFSQRPTWAHSLVGDAPWNPELGAQIVSLVRRSLVGEVVRASDGLGVAPMIPELFHHAGYDCDPDTK